MSEDQESINKLHSSTDLDTLLTNLMNEKESTLDDLCSFPMDDKEISKDESSMDNNPSRKNNSNESLNSNHSVDQDADEEESGNMITNESKIKEDDKDTDEEEKSDIITNESQDDEDGKGTEDDEESEDDKDTDDDEESSTSDIGSEYDEDEIELDLPADRNKKVRGKAKQRHNIQRNMAAQGLYGNRDVTDLTSIVATSPRLKAVLDKFLPKWKPSLPLLVRFYRHFDFKNF
jgi:hypothetical protein